MNKKTRTFKDLLRGEKTWMSKSTDGLTVPIGWDEKGEKVIFTLSNETPHALMGGSTGSGKSNLLHVILCSLCNRYSPEELQICFLDMKDGVEASRYIDRATGKAWLPHAWSILAGDFHILAKQILSQVKDEITSRIEMFKKGRVASFSAWRTKNHRAMPRMLVIVEEFTRLFEDRDLAKNFEICLRDIMMLGRSCGIHVLLASQVPDNLPYGVNDVFLEQAVLRLALPNASGVLGIGNHGDDVLQVPQCILNPFKGKDEEMNKIFVHPLFDNYGETPTNLDGFRKRMAKAAKAAGIPVLSDCEVYDSDITYALLDGSGLLVPDPVSGVVELPDSPWAESGDIPDNI